MMADPFAVVGDVPTGMSYQWVAEYVDAGCIEPADTYRQALDNGWVPVPANRHPEMPRWRGHIAHGGQVLMEKAAEAVNAEHQTTFAKHEENEQGAFASIRKAITDAGGRFDLTIKKETRAD